MKVYFLVVLVFSFLINVFPQPIDQQKIRDLEEHGTTATDLKLIYPESTLDSTNWKVISNAVNPIGRPAWGVIGGYLFIFGGQNQTSQAYALRLSDGIWVQSTPATAPGYNASACVAHGELYKMSGTGSVSVFEKFTPNTDGTGTWTVLASGPSAVMNAQSSIIYDHGNYIYASSADYNTPANSAFARYNISQNTWETLVGSPNPKRYAGMAYINGVIYLIGGLTPTGDDPLVCQKYDVTTQTWSIIAPAPEPLNFTKWSVTTDDRYVWLIGSGGGYSSYPLSNKVYYYDPQDNSWHLESILPADRGLAVGVFLTDHNKLFFGGGNTGGSGTNFQTDCWEGTGGIYVPVELQSFTADISEEDISINWITASETNNSHFIIERSNDGNSFDKIGLVTGNGTSTEMHSYAFMDKAPNTGKFFYRLKQVDFNGSYTYSKIIAVDVNINPNTYALFQNYPNPFNPECVIKFAIPDNRSGNVNVNLSLYDITGTEIAVLLNENKAPGVYEFKFNSSLIKGGLNSGIYFYRLRAGGFESTKKMVLMK